jgi:hypothetical protein
VINNGHEVRYRVHYFAARVVAVILLVGIVSAGEASTIPRRASGDAALVATIKRGLPRLESANQVAADGRGPPEATQAQYDAARDLDEGIAAARPISRGCLALRDAAEQLIRAAINQAEGVDRPSQALLALGIRRASAARATLSHTSQTCGGGRTIGRAQTAELLEPRTGETFAGRIRAVVPVGTTSAELRVNGRVWRRFPARPPRATLNLSIQPGSYQLELHFFHGERLLGRAEARDTWLLPSAATNTAAATIHSRDLDARLAAIANGYDGHVAIWLQNLRTGEYGSWNADARFPAASTVKLAVLVAALRKFGPRPEKSRVAYELETLGGWSSNLAANRLLVQVAGSETAGSNVAEKVLNQLGATSSTYTGAYRVGTAVDRPGGDAPDPPPLVSKRVTTARDLARILVLLNRAAMGRLDGLQKTGLTRHEAQVGLKVLLASEPTGDNLGLFRPWLAPTFPMAQKNGWLLDARHTAAILYAADGPRIVVLLTYKPGETRARAALLGRRLLRLALRT